MASNLVLVTGASGYVAGHCVLKLLERGYRVRGTLRSLSRADEVRQWLTRARRGVDPGDALSFVAAELTEKAGWGPTMEGVGYVLHVASPIPATAPKDPER
jgi:nucleoside-diphosphate-sugar epimerase